MEWWILAFFKIVLINIILSGDNAIVIAMASKNLPEHQKRKAIFWGAFGAIALRVLLTIVAIQLLKIPYLSAIGALLLLWIAIKLLKGESEQQINSHSKLDKVIMTIIMADFIMSLDNVIAITAVAHGDYLLIILGLLLSIPLIVWGSTLILKLMEKYPAIVYAGAALLGFTGGEMLLSDNKVQELLGSADALLHWIIPISFALGVVLIGWIMNRVQIIILNKDV